MAMPNWIPCNQDHLAVLSLRSLAPNLAKEPQLVAVKVSHSEGFEIGRMRHYELLGRASSFVKEAVEKVDRGETLPDLLSGDLRAALSSLGEVTGEVSTDDVLNYIFAEFCIGK